MLRKGNHAPESHFSRLRALLCPRYLNACGQVIHSAGAGLRLSVPINLRSGALKSTKHYDAHSYLVSRAVRKSAKARRLRMTAAIHSHPHRRLIPEAAGMERSDL